MRRHCPDEAQKGIEELEGILEGLLEEFQWQTVAEILQLALHAARQQKETAYLKAKSCEENLRKLRQRGN